MATRSEQVCCCGARTWALVIGWFQCIVNMMCFFSHAAELATLDRSVLVGIDQPEVQELKLAAQGMTEEQADAVISLIKGFYVLSIIIDLLTVALGLVLIGGVNKEKPNLVFSWIISTVVLSILIILGFGFGMYVLPAHSVKVSLSIIFGFTLVIQAFFLWVVDLHRRELEQSRMPAMHPVKV